MAFAPKTGCPMCGNVSKAQQQRDSLAPSAGQPDILWHDNNFTAYRETTNPVSSRGHVVLAFK